MRMATDAATRMEELGKPIDGSARVVRKDKKPLKMGDSLHLDDDWAWNQGDGDWDGVQDRGAKKEEKRRRDKERVKKRIEKAAYVGQCSIGLGPIKQESIEYFYKITGDYDLSKKMAAAEFLTAYLKFDHSEMSDIDITDTKLSAKGDEILYIVMDNPEKIRNIRRRLADCRDERIKTREYIPPQFYHRYIALGRIASDMRSKNRNLKTQIRFLQADIALFVKTKGSDDPFTEVMMEEVEETEKLPEIDQKAAWRRKAEQPPWRRTSPNTREIVLKSLAGKEKPVLSSNRMEGEGIRSRDSSGSPDRFQRKKTHKSLAADSSGTSSSSDDSRKVDKASQGAEDD